MHTSRMEQLKTLLAYGLTYVLWAVSLPLAGWVIIDIRDTILTVIAVINAQLYHSGTREAFYANLQLRAADTTSWILVGAVMVAVLVLIENIYRIAMLAGRLWSRFFLTLAVCFGLLGLTGLTNDLARLTIGVFTWRGLFGPAVYGLLALLFYGLSRTKRLPGNPNPDSLTH